MPTNKNDLEWKATCKVYPAVADLQAISGFLRKEEKKDNVGAGTYHHDIYTVPAGRIFTLNFIMAYAWQADPTTVRFMIRSGGTDYIWYTNPYAGAFTQHKQFVDVVYDEAEIVRVEWLNCIATNDVTCVLFGYLIDKY